MSRRRPEGWRRKSRQLLGKGEKEPAERRDRELGEERVCESQQRAGIEGLERRERERERAPGRRGGEKERSRPAIVIIGRTKVLPRSRGDPA